MFFILLALLAFAAASGAAWPDEYSLKPRAYINNTGLTDQVGWDKYSFYVKGKRVFIQSGEFHGFRLPVIGLWKDIMQKAKAAGLNTISVYTHWAMINPKSGVIDLEGVNDLQPLLDAAKEAGLWIIARPGPYINSETTAGGVPGHVLTLPGDTPWNLYNGMLRSNLTIYHDAWQQYVDAITQVIAKNQITEGGPVIMAQIENEYYNGAGQNEYILELKDAFRRNGIVVPTMHNDPGMYRNLINEPDIYAFDCSNPSRWRDITTAWRTYHETVMPNIPFMIPEYQGGAFSKRGVQTNEMCRQMTNVNSLRVLNYQTWASGSTAISFYMFYGGTNWGNIPYPIGETSYDFAAPIAESRELTDKFYELKLQSMFLRSFPDLRNTDLKSEDETTIPGLHATTLVNPENGAEFRFYRHSNISDWSVLPFTETFGTTNVSRVLPGRDSMYSVVNVGFGAHSRIVYSTASLFSHLTIDGADVLVAYGFNDTTYEIALLFDTAPEIITESQSFSQQYDAASKVFTLKLKNKPGIATFSLNGGSTRVIFADYSTATRLWMPTIASPSGSQYVEIDATTPLLIHGPYLVRTANLDGQTLALTGDIDKATTLSIWAPKNIIRLTWNGAAVNTKAKDGVLTGTVGGTEQKWSLPDLHSLDWVYADSLPEISPTFDDSSLTSADHTNTTSLFPPYYGGPWILYADDCEFSLAGNLLWRGAFEHNSTSTTVPTAVNLSISGGIHFAASVWLNEHYLGPSYVPSVPTTNESYPVTADLLREGTNYVTVLQDHMGHNLAGMIVCCTPGGRQRDLQQPKGIQGYYLEGRDSQSQFTGWKLAGNFGGEDAPDKARKILNEGGLFGERAGWHLPGFDASSWVKRAPWDGLSAPGVGWFRTSFSLNIPDGHDVHLAFVFSSATGKYRAQLYVNGWHMGKRIANLGPQTSFVVQEGILNYSGVNEVSISLWALEDGPENLKIPSIELVQTSSYKGGVGRVTADAPKWKDLRG
ncbi:glycoside hydrolase family 35 protein [Flagelloscypha sp. PMI_526]|nr:glycoside hydrolase family 35 protein [Flagelloscypha sp. PMI_526]